MARMALFATPDPQSQALARSLALHPPGLACASTSRLHNKFPPLPTYLELPPRTSQSTGAHRRAEHARRCLPTLNGEGSERRDPPVDNEGWREKKERAARGARPIRQRAGRSQAHPTPSSYQRRMGRKRGTRGRRRGTPTKPGGRNRWCRSACSRLLRPVAFRRSQL